MRIALLNPVFWPEVRRGSERFARELADGLLADGEDVRLITSHAGPRTVSEEDGLEVVRVRRLPGNGRLDRRQFEHHLTHLPAVYAELRRGHDDVAHALYPTDALAALRWRDRAGGGPVVLSYMGIPHRVALANRRLRKEIVQRACREADAVVALSRVAAEGFERWLGVQARVIPPGVDLDAFTPDPDARAANATILCAADHTQPRKRVQLLVDAVAVLRRKRPGLRLVLSRVAGASAPRGDFVEERDLDDRAELAAANREAWVHALPSQGEAFGLVLAEALACGTAVVGTNAELAGDPATGRLLDQSEDDPRVVAAILEEALDLATVPGTAAACRARAEAFDARLVARRYADLYKELLGRAA